MLKQIFIKVLVVKPRRSYHILHRTAGFTLIEFLVVILIIGILSAIAAPAWIGFVSRQQVNKANDAVFSAIQEAQREAKRRKLIYSVSFRTNNNIPQIAIYPNSDPTNYWQNLGADLGIPSRKILLGTNLTNQNTTTSSTSVSYASAFSSSAPQTITFDYTGSLNLPVTTNTNSLTAVQNANLGNKGLIVVVAVPQTNAPTQPTDVKRCIIVRTLLGSIKYAKNTDCN